MTCPTQFADVAAALAANGYRPVPILAGSKRPPITDWQHFEFAQGCERRFGDCGAGVLLGDVVALDIASTTRMQRRRSSKRRSRSSASATRRRFRVASAARRAC